MKRAGEGPWKDRVPAASKRRATKGYEKEEGEGIPDRRNKKTRGRGDIDRD